ncbi:YczE/YyaS/YitT family protein [Amphibacillus sediminis]|uniref:YczE/YyaS/YitT family protein n=1 Tax=Amphibacillus sediminis TaxID=360185 RepID=UPI00082E4711|nr:hypothetical protein [Amphibacillus sediminis]
MFLKRGFIYFIGIFLIGSGVASIIKADLGAGAWDALYVGLSHRIGLTTGTWVWLIGLIIIMLNAWIGMERPDFSAFLTVFILGNVIDFALYLLLDPIQLTGWFPKVLLFAIGFILIPVGSGIYLQARFATNPFDKLMLALNQRLNISIGLARFISEFSALILAWLFKGPVSLGTVFIALFIGPAIQLNYRYFNRLLNDQEEWGIQSDNT